MSTIRKTWLAILLSGLTVVAAAGITVSQDRPDNEGDERVSPANNYGFSEATPLGDWSAQVDLDQAQVEDPNVPVAVAGLRIYAGKGDWGKQRMVQSVTLANRTPKAVAQVRFGWIIITKDDREARKNQEAALVNGYTSLFASEGQTIKSVYLDFVKSAKPLVKAGALNGDYYLRLRVSEVQFVDGSSWQERRAVSVVRAHVFAPCAIEIVGPSTIDPGMPLVLKVKVTGNLPSATPGYKWWLSAGTIIKGEGTDEITIDTAGLGGQTLTATAELTGAPPGCKNVESKTTSINSPPRPHCPLDQYGDIKFEDEKARLDNFVIQIFNYEQARGLMMVYAGKETFKGEAAYRLQRAKSYLSNVRGLDLSRLMAVDCGFAPDLTTVLWVVPPGVDKIPECASTWQIPLSEVKFTKPRPTPVRKRR